MLFWVYWFVVWFFLRFFSYLIAILVFSVGHGSFRAGGTLGRGFLGSHGRIRLLCCMGSNWNRIGLCFSIGSVSLCLAICGSVVPSVVRPPRTPFYFGSSRYFLSGLVPPVTCAKAFAMLRASFGGPDPLNTEPFLRSMAWVYPTIVWSAPDLSTSFTSSAR